MAFPAERAGERRVRRGRATYQTGKAEAERIEAFLSHKFTQRNQKYQTLRFTAYYYAMAGDDELQSQVDALKASGLDTRSLYREVCVLLFHRHGVTPTANRLYQLVRRGSMSTPTEVLREFWQDLRERARVKIDRPDLPPALQAAGGEWLARWWAQAQDAAAAQWDLARTEAEAAARQAQLAMAAMQQELDELRQRAPRLQAELSAALERELDATRQLATNQGRVASMTEILRETANEMQRLRQELLAAQRDTARAVGEANALRVQLGLSRGRRGRKPAAGLPGSAPQGQDDLALDPGST